MNFAKKFTTLASALALTLVAVAPAMSQQLDPEPAQYFGTLLVDHVSGRSILNPNGVELVGDVYNNTNPQAPANFGFASTDLASTWGDRLATTGKGLLQAQDVTIFNAAGGPLLTATLVVSYFDGPSSTFLGGYTTNVNFGAGLPVGSFAIVTTTGLGAINLVLNTQDVIVTQQITAKTGTTNKLGIASLDPPSIGSSSNTMFISSSTVGPAGFYNIGNPPANANPGYRVNVSTAVPAAGKSWGMVKALYHQ